MKSAMLIAPGLAAAALLATAAARPLEGVYNTGAAEDGPSSLNIRFHACENDPVLTCGTIVGVVDPEPDAQSILPDGSPVLGFTMITGLEHDGDGEYRDGRINAVDESLEKGRMVWYDVKIDVLEDNRLRTRGCLAFVCPRTMFWTPVADETAFGALTVMPASAGR